MIGKCYHGLYIDASFRVVSENGDTCTVENTSSGATFDVGTEQVKQRIMAQIDGLIGV